MRQDNPSPPPLERESMFPPGYSERSEEQPPLLAAASAAAATAAATAAAAAAATAVATTTAPPLPVLPAREEQPTRVPDYRTLHELLKDLLVKERKAPATEPSKWEKAKEFCKKWLYGESLIKGHADLGKFLITNSLALYNYQVRYENKVATWFMIVTEFTNALSMYAEWLKINVKHKAIREKYKKKIASYENPTEEEKDSITKLIEAQKKWYYRKTVKEYDINFQYEKSMKVVLGTCFGVLFALNIFAIFSSTKAGENNDGREEVGPNLLLFVTSVVGVLGNLINFAVNFFECFAKRQQEAEKDMEDTAKALELSAGLEASDKQYKIVEIATKHMEGAVAVRKIQEEIARRAMVVERSKSEIEEGLNQAIISDSKEDAVLLREKLLGLWQQHPEVFERVVNTAIRDKQNTINTFLATASDFSLEDLSAEEMFEANDAWKGYIGKMYIRQAYDEV
jgi:hypothetical protein